MVSKKGLKVVKRNEIILIILVLGFVSYVFAAGAAAAFGDESLLRRGNYSGGTIFLNVTTSLNGSVTGYNVTCFYNSSGGPVWPNFTSGLGVAAFPTHTGNLTPVMWNGSSYALEQNFTRIIDISRLSDGITYNISCVANNGTAQNWTSVTNVTIDNTPPAVNFTDTTASTVTGATGVALVHHGNYSAADVAGVLRINVSVSDAIWTNRTLTNPNVYINFTNSTGQVNFTRARNHTGGDFGNATFYNVTINVSSTTLYPDGKYNITIYANDSKYLTNWTNDIHPNVNDTEYIQITIDRTNPSSVALTRGIGSTRNQNVLTITAADATSGVDNCELHSGSNTANVAITGRGSGTQTLTHTGLSCGQSYTYQVICYDQVDNAATSTLDSFSTTSCSDSSGSNGDSGEEVTSIEQVNVLTIEPETEATLSNFEEDMGVKEIKISVTEEASGVKVTVKKFDTEPAEVTISKTGNVHRYLQITSENLVNKMSQAIITIRVQRNWLSDNNISQANVALFKLDESAGEWDELSTVYKSEDDDYYYYDAEVTSFSYFAIAEKAIEEPEEPEPTEKNLLWLWIVIGIVIVAIVAGGGLAAKKRR